MPNSYINDFINNSQNQSNYNINPNYNIIPMIMNSFNDSNQNMYFSNPNNINNLQNNLLMKKNEENLINNCVTLCKEQLEYRQLQKIIDNDPSIASNIIYEKIKDKVQEISCD